jgi:cysteinyl-tRNA synthetase
MMKLYNTLTKQVETITPLNPPKVTVYTCGPTVYDYPHVGNWFTFIRYDLLVRALRLSGYEPQWVMNITDVGHLVSDADEGEDKLEKGAHREGKTAWDVAKFYGDYFITGLTRLNITQPDMLPRATEHIQEQIALIQTLEDKGYTYVIDDGVYYDTAKFPKYADFAQLDLDEQQAGKRVNFNEQKRNPTDFALWKFSPKDHQRDMEWGSPWGKGFPGWHIECSAMSMKYLGETIDIHAGGIDHLPVHHTNEIAQSEGATGKQFAKYWMHTNHVLVDGEKISKSTGNGIVLEDIEAKGFSLEVFRLLVLQSHYTSQSKFSWDDLEAAQVRLKSYQAMADLRWQIPDKAVNIRPKWAEEQAQILAYVQEDLSTPMVLAKLSVLQDVTEAIDAQDKDMFDSFISFIDGLLGTKFSEQGDITPTEKQLIAERENAREAKDWTKSDELRDQLKTKGIGLRDTGGRTTWFRL